MNVPIRTIREQNPVTSRATVSLGLTEGHHQSTGTTP